MNKSNGIIYIPGFKNNKYEPPDCDFTGFNFEPVNNYWSETEKSFVPWDIYAVKQCGSTMDELFYLMEEHDKKDFTSFAAQIQNTGRGQHKRKWVSAKGNLSVSIQIPFIFNDKWSENFLPLIFGDLIIDALADFGVKAQIKWPNDIFFKGKKLGGILVEKKKNFYIAGIGLNLFYIPQTDELEDDFSIKPVCLFGEGIKISSPLLFWNASLEHVFNFFDKRLAKESPSDLINSLIQKIVWLGEEVFLDNPYEGVKKYILKGISDEGGLVLYDGRALKVVYSGRIRSVNN
jgi:BirA family biotin operon repressor/biotin-[acetyl-CoA-carboxylase] ligase